MTQLSAADGHVLAAYEVAPSAAAASVVIIQEIFGVNAHIRSVVDRAPLVRISGDRPGTVRSCRAGVELDYDAAEIEQGRAMAMAVKWDGAMADVVAAVEHVSDTGPVAAIGSASAAVWHGSRRTS